MKHIMISAGEASGDKHAAQLVCELKQQLPDVKFSGLGGEQLAAEGVELYANTAEKGVVGLFELIPHLRMFKRWLNMFRQKLCEEKPDLLILVDFSGFNLRLAKTAKTQGIKVLYYISPQVWAWRKHRINTIRDTVDMMAVILPFEVAMYQQYGVPAKYVGHPLLQVQPSMSPVQARQQLGIDEKTIVIGLLPGSRRNEVKFNLSVMLASAQQLAQRYNNIAFVLPVAKTLTVDEIQSHIPIDFPKVFFIEDQPHDAIQICDAAIAVSGTVTLEVALLEVPMVVIYKGVWLSYWIMRVVLQFRMGIVNHVALCNILCGDEVVPELFQHDANANKIATEISRYLEEPEHCANVKQRFRDMKASLAAVKADEQLVDIAVDLL